MRLDDQLLREAKALAARTGRSLTSLIEDSLREAIARSKRGQKRRKVVLPAVDGEGLQPGVDIDDSASLLDLMQDSRDPD